MSLRPPITEHTQIICNNSPSLHSMLCGQPAQISYFVGSIKKEAKSEDRICKISSGDLKKWQRKSKTQGVEKLRKQLKILMTFCLRSVLHSAPSCYGCHHLVSHSVYGMCSGPNIMAWSWSCSASRESTINPQHGPSVLRP